MEWTLHFWRFLDFSFTIESVATPQGIPLLSTHSMRPEINQKSKYSIQCGFTCVVTCHVTSLNIQVNQSQNEKLNNYSTIKEQISQSKKCMAKYIDKYVFISILYIYTSTVQVYIYKYSHFAFSRYWSRKDLWAALSQPGWGEALSGCNESASKLKFSTIITDD